MKNRNFLQSLHCALKGLLCAIKSEHNLRLDLSLMLSVVYFSLFYGINKVEWVLLVLIFALVISAELFNTALENAVDTATKEYNETAKIAKDTAAAAVFVCSLGALVCAFIVFGDIGRWIFALKTIFANPIYGSLFCVLAIADIACLLYRRKGN